MKTTTAVAATKFKTLTLVDNGILLGYGNRKEIAVSFSELDKIYINSHKLNAAIQFIFILFPFLFIPFAVEYIAFDFVVLLVLFTVISIFIKVHNYKWYRMIIRLKDGTFYRKKFSLKLKSESLSIMYKVQKSRFNYNVVEYVCT